VWLGRSRLWLLPREPAAATGKRGGRLEVLRPWTGEVVGIVLGVAARRLGDIRLVLEGGV
jgi:hypothetical protein